MVHPDLGIPSATTIPSGSGTPEFPDGKSEYNDDVLDFGDGIVHIFLNRWRLQPWEQAVKDVER